MRKLILLFVFISSNLCAQSVNSYILGAVNPVGGAPQVVFDVASSAQDTDGGNTASSTHTTAAGSNLLIVVGIAIWESGGGIAVSAITYDGESLTQAISVTANTNSEVDIWYAVAPNTGSNTLSITTTGGPDEVVWGVTTFSGVNQSTPIGDTGSDTGNNPSVAITIDTGDFCIDAHVWFTGTSTNGANQTQRYEELGAGDIIDIRGTTEELVSAVMSRTHTASGADQGLVAVELNAN